jgi:hypothetical protein
MPRNHFNLLSWIKNSLEKEDCYHHNRHMVVIPANRKRFGRRFDSAHLHHQTCFIVMGVHWLRRGERRLAGDSKGDGRNPRKSTNANDERFALAA